MALRLFMPGFTKPLSEWSLRALEQMRIDLLEQRAAARSPAERDDIERRIAILRGEAMRRHDGLSPEDEQRLRQLGADQPFNARSDARQAERSPPALSYEPSHEAARDRDEGLER